MVLLKREIEILRAVDHPTLIRLEDVYEDDVNLHLVRSKKGDTDAPCDGTEKQTAATLLVGDKGEQEQTYISIPECLKYMWLQERREGVSRGSDIAFRDSTPYPA